jgi:hypothetical protein
VSSVQWANTSNNLVYSAMTVYALAVLVLAAERAFGARSRVVSIAEPERVAFGTVKQAVFGDAPGIASAPSAPPPETSRLPSWVRAVRLTEHGERLAGIGLSLTVLGTALLGLGILARAFATHRAPWANMYEYALAASFVASVVYLVLARSRDGRRLGPWVIVTVLLVLGLSVTVLYVPAAPVVPALQSYWLIIHVSAATLAAGLFTVAALCSALHLLASRRAAKGTPLVSLPSPANSTKHTVSRHLASRSGPLPSWRVRYGLKCPGAGIGAGTPRRCGRSSRGWCMRPTCTPAQRPGGKAVVPPGSRYWPTAHFSSTSSGSTSFLSASTRTEGSKHRAHGARSQRSG